MNNIFLLSIFLLTQLGIFAQEIPIGSWREHLPYNDAISVSYGEPLVYCATNSAAFIVDRSDNSIDRLSIINGLSDIELSKIKFNPFNKKVVIAYRNGNLDILDQNNQITNISFIKSSNVIGGKAINHIFFQNQLAYLSTEFGIVVLNTDRLEIVESYFFGPNGSEINTTAVTLDDTNIYAATDQGVFFANKNSVNLSDFNSWTQIQELGSSSYSGVVSFAGRIFASSDSQTNLSDSVFFNDGGIWQKFSPNGFNIDNIDLLNTDDPTLIIDQDGSIDLYDTSFNLTKSITIFNTQEVVQDQDGNFWFANNFGGLVRTDNNGGASTPFLPNSPNSSNSFAIDILDNDLWFVSGALGLGINRNIINHRTNNSWSNLSSTLKNDAGQDISDMVSVAINPRDPSNVYAGSWSSGLLEFNNNEVTQIFNARNSVLDSVFFGNVTSVGTLEFDNDNNLWVTSSFGNNDMLSVKSVDDKWFSYGFPQFTDQLSFYVDMVIDRNNYKWIIDSGKNQIIVFDDNNTLDITSDDRTKIIPSSLNNSNLQGVILLSIQEDNDGEMWIGTNAGPAVFFSPSQVFDEDIRAEQIFIQQDGNTEILLGTNSINAIAIDGANRKWFATASAGTFLLDETGNEQIFHFTESNSPLFSNNLLDININKLTGEVFFATDKGLISYKGDATEGGETFDNIFVYPNPVRPDYEGVIAIKGLLKKTDVKITDVSGNLVFETTSLGGQAIWNGKNVNGERVKTGVYLVFSLSENGDQRKAAKILFIN